MVHSVVPEPDASEATRGPFADVVPRRSVDELFRSLQDSLVTYTGQADLKANLVITASSLSLTIAATRWSEDSLRPGLTVLIVGAMAALLMAITVVIPKFRLPRKSESRNHLEAHENPLFFGHFASMPRERFVEILGALARDDHALYEAQALDVHDQGRYLIQSKYRHLRAAYIILGATFVVALVVQGIASVV